MLKTCNILMITTIMLLGSFTVSMGDARVDQLTRSELGGSVGKMAKLLGGKQAAQGITSQIRIKGQRMMTRTGRSGQLIDLAAEKIYTIDFKKKRYTEMSFEAFRQQMKDVRQQLGGASPFSGAKAEGSTPTPEYVTEIKVDETGQREIIGGKSCREVVVTITLYPKGSTLEKGGGTILTAHTWQGPRLSELAEMMNFQRRFAEKLDVMTGLRQLGQQFGDMTGGHALGEAMKAFQEKESAFEGSSMRTELTVETVAGSNPPAGGAGTAARPRSLGGMFKGLGLGRKRSKEDAPDAGTPGRTMTLHTTSEITATGSTVSDDEVAIPAGFKRRS